jgi:pimeloyl-ACP methyl ester carboxylesterase
MFEFKVSDFPFFYFYDSKLGKPKYKIFFSHANGIPSSTYSSFFQQLIKTTGACIFSYDMRGIGRSSHIPPFGEKGWTWELLSKDHVELFQKLPQAIGQTLPDVKEWLEDTSIPWVMMGHSLGAWITFLSASVLKLNDIILLDPPILDWKTVFAWNICLILKARHRHPMGMKVRKRRKIYPSENDLLTSFKKSKLMRTWSDEAILNYIHSSFSKDPESEKMLLRHDPEWEAKLFETMPSTSAVGFLHVNLQTRLHLRANFIVGELSDTCNKAAKNYIKLFLPKLTWKIIPQAQHMFPIERQAETADAIKDILYAIPTNNQHKN